jgi:hypothetical protein
VSRRFIARARRFIAATNDSRSPQPSAIASAASFADWISDASIRSGERNPLAAAEMHRRLPDVCRVLVHRDLHTRIAASERDEHRHQLRNALHGNAFHAATREHLTGGRVPPEYERDDGRRTAMGGRRKREHNGGERQTLHVRQRCPTRIRCRR